MKDEGERWCEEKSEKQPYRPLPSSFMFSDLVLSCHLIPEPGLVLQYNLR